MQNLPHTCGSWLASDTGKTGQGLHRHAPAGLLNAVFHDDSNGEHRKVCAETLNPILMTFTFRNCKMGLVHHFFAVFCATGDMDAHAAGVDLRQAVCALPLGGL